jgi:hypothetical protein
MPALEPNVQSLGIITFCEEGSPEDNFKKSLIPVERQEACACLLLTAMMYIKAQIEGIPAYSNLACAGEKDSSCGLWGE